MNALCPLLPHILTGRLDLRVKNTTPDTVELIYEIPRKIYDKCSQNTESIEERIYKIEHVQYVNIVAQNDDISN